MYTLFMKDKFKMDIKNIKTATEKHKKERR